MGFLSFLRPRRETAAPAAEVPAKAPAAVPDGAPAQVGAVPGDSPGPAPVSAPAPLPTGDPDAIVVRAEIVDERNRLCGYRFSVPLDGRGLPMPEPLMIETLAAAQLAAFAQTRLALVELSAQAVALERYLPLMAPHTVFMLDRKADALPAERLAEHMAALRQAGCKVALRGVSLDAEDVPLLALCDVAMLYLNEHTLAALQTLAKQLRMRYPDMMLAVDGVETWDEQRMCLSWGCNYFLGSYLTTSDQVDPDAKVDQSRMTAIELLNLLRSDAELPAMIEVAKRDPGMTYQVLQWANAPANGQAVKVTSLQQAFMVLGRNQLYRGLTVSMFRLGGGAHRERDASLLEVALTRARFLETCSPLPLARRDELFLVGLLSLFDVLLGVPMAALVDKMRLSDDIRDVLLGSEGVYGPYLMLALLLERDKVERALEIARKLGIDTEALAAVGKDAFAWAQESMRYTREG